MLYRIIGLAMFAMLMLSVDCRADVPGAKSSGFDPAVFKVDEDKYLGKQAPDVRMTDENGKSFTLGDYAGKPVILSIIYYRCVTVCPVLNEGLADALRKIDMKLGEDYNVITVSFADEEKPEDAARFRKNLTIKQKGELPESFPKWVFAVSSKEEIKKLTEAVGYKFFFSSEDKAFLHPNMYIFLSPDGKIMRYLYGLMPPAYDVRLAVIEAAGGRTGKTTIIRSAVLACYSYDPKIGGYRLNMNLVAGMIGLSMLIATLLAAALQLRRMNKRAIKPIGLTDEGTTSPKEG
jgi:protein SCO1/2